MLGQMSCFESRMIRLRMWEALLLFPEIAHAVVPSSIRFCDRAVTGVAKMLGVSGRNRRVHSAGEIGARRRVRGAGVGKS